MNNPHSSEFFLCCRTDENVHPTEKDSGGTTSIKEYIKGRRRRKGRFEMEYFGFVLLCTIQGPLCSRNNGRKSGRQQSQINE